MIEEKYQNIKYADKIIENGIIHVGSIFQFKNGIEELYPFLHVCDVYNCTVCFDNEELIINPKSKGIASDDILLLIYASMAQFTNFGDNYIKYLDKIRSGKLSADKVDWVKGQHEPILKDE